MQQAIRNRFLECALLGLASHGAGLFAASKEKFGELIHANDPELTSRVLNRVWAEAERISGKASIGLLVAHGAHASSLLGLLFYRAMAAESLGHAIQETLVDRQALSVGEHVRWQRLRDGSYALGIDYVGGTARCSPARAEFTLAVVLKLLSHIAGRTIRPSMTHLHRHPVDQQDMYRNVFGDRIRSDDTKSALILAAHDVEAPLPTAAPMLRKLLDPVLATVFPIGAGLSMVSRVQSAIHEELPTGDTARAHIASRLRLSERTLQRKLAAENTSYAEVLDQVRAKLAQALSEQGVRGKSKLAYELGYADPSCVYRAMRRWGLTAQLDHLDDDLR